MNKICSKNYEIKKISDKRKEISNHDRRKKMKTFKQFLKEQSDAEEKFEELIISIPPNWKIEKLTLLIEGRWLTSFNNLEYRIDKRPAIYGGDQMHIKDRNGRMWAYRQDGKRSEPHKYKLKATREVKELVRTFFHLPDNLHIEGYLLKADGSKYLVEI